MASASAPGDSRLALGAGIGCYLIWGLVPLVFQTIGRMGVSPFEILSHRVIWGLPLAVLLVALAGQGPHVGQAFRTPRTLGWLAVSSALLAVNWVIYIGAVNSGRMLETSLGYYITPLLNMAAGAMLFRERIDRMAYAAMALASVGVGLQALALGHLPIVSVALAVTFGGYGVVKKRAPVDAQTSFLIECLAVAIPAAGYLGWLASRGDAHFGTDPSVTAWLIACGPITAVPLVLFAWAARRIPLSAMGFLQFLSPTIGFVIGVSEGESFTPMRAVSFLFIWAGAAVFLVGIWVRARAVRLAIAEVAAAAE